MCGGGAGVRGNCTGYGRTVGGGCPNKAFYQSAGLAIPLEIDRIS